MESKLFLAVAIAAFLSSSPVEGGEVKVRAACAADAIRLCRPELKISREAVINCMLQKIDRVGARCLRAYSEALAK